MIKKIGLDKLNKMMTLADKVAITIILLISFSMIVLTPQLIANSGSQSKQVVITLDDQELYRYNLESSKRLKEISFNFTVKNKEYQGILKMKDSRVKLERLSEEISPLPIHAEMGWISEPYQMILCLPVKLAVTIETRNKKEQKIDAMSF